MAYLAYGFSDREHLANFLVDPGDGHIGINQRKSCIQGRKDDFHSFPFLFQRLLGTLALGDVPHEG